MRQTLEPAYDTHNASHSPTLPPSRAIILVPDWPFSHPSWILAPARLNSHTQ